MPSAARDALLKDHAQALALVKSHGIMQMRKVLEAAAADLEHRLSQRSIHGRDEDTFSAVRMKATLAQIREVLRRVTRGMSDTLVGQSEGAATAASRNLLRYLDSAHKKFTGAVEPLALHEASIIDAAAHGARASILRRLSSPQPGEEPHRAGAGILQRYGHQTIGHFEEVLQRGLVSRKPWSEVRDELVDASPFLQGAPAHWAERIIRTETAGVYNRAGWEAVREADSQLGDMVKVLSATFDDRTAADSFAVHGQIRRPEEAFESWHGLYQHPPDRPNDREVVVPHRISWPIPPYLHWRSDSEIEARWVKEGRKGAHPPRPQMTTVPLEQFGKPTGPAPGQERKPEEEQAPPPTRGRKPAVAERPEIPEERFAFVPAPRPPRLPRRPDIPIPDLSAQRRRVAEQAKEDAELLATYSSVAERARKAIEKSKKLDVLDEPTPFKSGVPPKEFGYEPVDTARADAGLSMMTQRARKAIPIERISLDDFVSRSSEHESLYVRENIRHLSEHGGRYMDDDEVSHPVLVRLGDKLYPMRSMEENRLAAAKHLGLQTFEAHVIDGNALLAKRVELWNKDVDEKQATRDHWHDRHLARVEAHVRKRVEREHQGDPKVVAARVKHQPAAYAKEYAAKYGQAAPSIGWGRAMLERGLDLPVDHLKKIAAEFESDPGHPFHQLGVLLRDQAITGGGARTLREHLAKASGMPDFRKDMFRAGAAILGHLDAIDAHPAVPVGSVPKSIAEKRVKHHVAMVARVTDGSVEMPEHFGVEEARREHCDSSSILGWRNRESTLGLNGGTPASTYFHEIGHSIDAADRGRGMRASAFLDARTDPIVEPTKLKDLEPGSSYADHEVARPDEFYNAYVGKDYGREDGTYYGPKTGHWHTQVHRATEVTSMGVEAVAEWRTTGLRHDPEHFYFGLGQLGGH